MEKRDFDITGPIKKVTTSTIIIMPPRSLWPKIQQIRVANIHELRAGPHISLTYPFIHEKLLPDAAVLLIPVIAKIKPFTITLQDFGMFENGNDVNLHLKPEATPAGALHNLEKAIEKVFPHCNDVDIISNDGFTPHMSVSGFKGSNAKEMADQCIEKYSTIFKDEPVQFQVTEIYICARVGNDPFEIRHVIFLDSARIDITERPYFGPKSPQISDILFIGNLPRTEDITDDSLKLLFPSCREITLWKQPDGTSRGCAWVHFETSEQAHDAYSIVSRRTLKLGSKGQQPTITLASRMCYP